MLPMSRVSCSLITRRTALRKPHFAPALSNAKRTYVQPSGADRASVVDIPSAYQDESHFAPRAGNCPPSLTNSCSGNLFPRRHAWLQARTTTAGGRNHQKNPAYLPRHAGSRNYSVLDICSFLTTIKATTPVDPRVLDAMLPYLTDQYGNPHSRTHAYGWEAEKGVENARKVCFARSPSAFYVLMDYTSTLPT